MNNDAPIGVFDSGIGGLTVAREIMRQIPNERIVYFGDTIRLPYGSKSKDNIIMCSRQIISFLQSQGVKAVVIACNTASALALEEMKQERLRSARSGCRGKQRKLRLCNLKPRKN